MKTPVILRFVFALIIAFTAAGTVQAQALRERMEARLPAIDGLKARGVVGENNQGFVALRGGGDKAAQIVADENQDRTQVYAHIAQKLGITPEQVGRRRARKIAEESEPGVWLQAPDGTWYQKKG